MPFFVLVVNWLSIFTLTDYRANEKPWIFLLSAIYLTFYFSMLSFRSEESEQNV